MHLGTLTHLPQCKSITIMALTLMMIHFFGCAMAGSKAGNPVRAAESTTQRDAADLASYHSQQAAEFRTLAERFDVEASWRVQQFGGNDEAAMRKRAFANEMWAEAERAARAAEESRREVSQAQLY